MLRPFRRLQPSGLVFHRPNLFGTTREKASTGAWDLAFSPMRRIKPDR